MTDHHVTPTTCPHCGKRNDCATNTDDGHRAPCDGDFTLCIGCGHFAVFEAGALRRSTPLEAARIAAHPGAARLKFAWTAYDQKKKAAGPQ
jgi:ornithine cyclodeaminase/alanine dehydrogenase-like protein (mu-crystallin family)